MKKWDNWGGDERYLLGQAYDQIHAIKLNEQTYFRRAYSAFGYEANTGKFQPLLENLDEAVESLLKDLRRNHSISREEKEKVASFWKDRVQANIDEKLMKFYFDLDSYASTVETIAAPAVVKTIFCLYDPEAQALKDVSTYFKKGHNAPIRKQTGQLFNRAVTRLLNYEGIDSSPHPNLSKGDTFSLASAYNYLYNLNTAFELTKTKK